MKQKEKQTTTIEVEKEIWKRLVHIKIKYEYRTLSDTVGALTKIEKKFKPELKEGMKWKELGKTEILK